MSVPRWLDGTPYYCNACGLGGAEVDACKEGMCDLETVEQAKARKAGNATAREALAALNNPPKSE